MSLAERKAETDCLSDLASKAGSSSSNVSLAKRRAAVEAKIQERAKRQEKFEEKHRKIEAEQKKM